MLDSIQLYDSRLHGEKPVEARFRNKMSKSSGFQNVLSQRLAHKEKPIDRKLMNACVEFESLFVANMFKEMRKTVHKGDLLHGGYAEEIFEDMLYDQYSIAVSKNSNLGLAKLLYDEMSRK